MQLHGKRVVILGGSSEIGLETARLALAEGAFVIIAGRSEERLRRASESIAPAGERPMSLILLFIGDYPDFGIRFAQVD